MGPGCAREGRRDGTRARGGPGARRRKAEEGAYRRGATWTRRISGAPTTDQCVARRWRAADANDWRCGDLVDATAR